MISIKRLAFGMESEWCAIKHRIINGNLDSALQVCFEETHFGKISIEIGIICGKIQEDVQCAMSVLTRRKNINAVWNV